MDASGQGCFTGLTKVDITAKGQTVDAAIELKPCEVAARRPRARPAGWPGHGRADAAPPGTRRAPGHDGRSRGTTGSAGMTGVGGTTGSAGMGAGRAAGMAGATGTGGTIQIVAPPS